MRIPPLLASLTRHKLTVGLMVAATAFTCAIVCNVALMIAQRLTLLNAPSGLDESSIVVVGSSRIDATQPSNDDTHKGWRAGYVEDVAALRAIPGVNSAAVAVGLPLQGGSSLNFSATPMSGSEHGVSVSVFFGGPDELSTLGLRLVNGRDFLGSEFVPADDGNGVSNVSAAIISRALAERLFHDRPAVGQLIYQGEHPIRVVGVVAHLMNMSPQIGADDNESAMLLPLEPDGNAVSFVVHASTRQGLDRIATQAVSALNNRDERRVLDDPETFAQLRAAYFQRDSAMVWLLLISTLALLTVTAAGIAGLAGFWVQQRTRSIGIRRALGATRTNILRYFLAENFIIASVGVAIGWALTYVLNLLLLKHYALRVLPPEYLLVGALAIWLIGQIAVLGPALRAAAVAPAVATRSV